MTFPFPKFIFSFIIILMLSYDAKSQFSRSWTYLFSPAENYEASGISIASLSSGISATAGIYRSATGSTKNTLLLTDASGSLVASDTSVHGSGYRKIIYDGQSHFYAAGTLFNDSLPISKIVVAKFDTTFSDRSFFVPDSGITFPGYDVLDLAVLNNENIVVASHWDAFPFVCVSFMCMDSAGSVLWERVDSSFQFSYDVQLLADLNGGFFAAGSGRDTSTSDDFIFVAHFESSGNINWSTRFYSPAHNFADQADMIRDVSGYLYVSGAVMDSLGQRGFLMKIDSAGMVQWNKTILPLSYLGIISDSTGNIYGATVPQNGLDVISVDKLDSSGARLDSISFQLNGYFTSELGDFKMIHNNVLVATGGLYVLSFPKSDLYTVAFDTSLNIIGYDIYDSLNLLGETGHAISDAAGGSIFVCGRMHYENQFETSNIGIIKYDLSGLINSANSVYHSGIAVYPNPSGGTITIRFDNTSGTKMRLGIYSTPGIEILPDELPAWCLEKKYDFTLSPGLYYVVLESGQQKSTRMISVME